MFGFGKFILTNLFVIMSVFAVESAIAQEKWQINRDKGTGDLVSVFFTSSNNGWVAGDEGYLAFTEDGGRTWARKELNTDADINEVYFRNNDNGYLVAGRTMYATSDGGKSWLDLNIIDADAIENGTAEFLSIRFNNKNQGFIIGSVLNDDGWVVDSLLLRTVDGGKSWSRILVPDIKTELIHLDFDGRQEGWIVGDKGVILATVDNGNSWVKQESGTTAALYNVDFRDSKDGFVVGAAGTVLRTEDGGKTWASISTWITKTLFRVNFVDDKTGWIVGSEGMILRTYDRGLTWVRQESNTSNNLYGLYMDKKYGWSVGKGGIIMRYDK